LTITKFLDPEARNDASMVFWVHRKAFSVSRRQLTSDYTASSCFSRWRACRRRSVRR
jgi:hypothetical protein